jgi:hypothetical protein
LRRADPYRLNVGSKPIRRAVEPLIVIIITLIELVRLINVCLNRNRSETRSRRHLCDEFPIHCHRFSGLL